MKLVVVSLGLILISILLPVPPQAQTQETPILKVTLVSRTIPAVQYPQGGESRIEFHGTPLLPDAKGQGKVDSKKGYNEILALFSELEPATKFGPEYLTYVLWAITPQGRPENLGEVVLSGTEAKLNVTTKLQAFGMIVTAEPYFAVTEPSDVVVLENEVRPDTTGTVVPVQARYELLQRGQYVLNVDASALETRTLDKKVPLDLYQARNAVSLAKSTGADRHASESFQRASQLLMQAENAQADRKGKKTVATAARAAVQSAHDARLIALQRAAEASLAQERQQAAEREARAKQEAQAEAEQRAQAQRRAEEAESRAQLELERQRAEQARMEAERARQEASRAQSEAQRKAETERLHQLELERQRTEQARLEAERAKLQAGSTAERGTADTEIELRVQLELERLRAEQARLEAERARREAEVAAERASRSQAAGAAAQPSAAEVRLQLELERLRAELAEVEAERVKLEAQAQAQRAVPTQAQSATPQPSEAERHMREELERLRAELARVEAQRAKLESDAATKSQAAQSAEVERRVQLEIERLRAEESRLQAESARREAEAAAERAARERATAEAARDAALAQQKAAEAKAETRQRLQQQLDAVVDTKDTVRGLIVSMTDVVFDAGSDMLRAGARENLARIATIVKSYPDLKLEIEGHTDSVGDEGSNERLSEARAAAVRNYLTQQGVPQAAIRARGLGESQPVASNDTPSGRQMNRRVELVVTGEAIEVR
jgi:outer membrane protein OmpA-like peptidoglycan-associated protein